jgi:hypothetical protein
LREVGNQIWKDSPPELWWRPRITALTVQPIRGGDGGYDAESGKLWIEAMLTDADPAVPEVLRLVWLITRMAIETHIRDRSGDQSLARPWSLVSVPLVLTAAASLELVNEAHLPIKRAMELWQFGDASVAEKLADWWRHFTRSPTPLPRALRVLEEVLESSDPAMVERSKDA